MAKDSGKAPYFAGCPHSLAVDQGTTGSTALVVDSDGMALDRGDHEVRQCVSAPGRVEHDAESLFQGLIDAGGEAAASSGRGIARLADRHRAVAAVLTGSEG